MTASPPLWERRRHWELMRPFLYYLVENFAPASWVTDGRVVDFSGGLGDLSLHMLNDKPASLTLTVPDAELDRPNGLPSEVEWRPGILAGDIREAFEEESVDLFCARMVFQFPRWEDERMDPDEMLMQIGQVLAPGGRVVVATHTFIPLQVYPSLRDEDDGEQMLARLDRLASAGAIGEMAEVDAHRISGLVEMVRYLGLPPREGAGGETGYGLKVPLLVQSFIDAGLTVDVVEDIEPFTYPLGVWERFEFEAGDVARLGAEVFELKRRHLLRKEAADPFQRPGVVRAMLRELESFVDLVWVPIVRVVGRKA